MLYAPAPQRTGRRGQPALKGARLGTPAEVARQATWRTTTVTRYGRTTTVHIAQIDRLWYGAFGPRPGQLILVRDDDDTVLALFTTDTTTQVEHIVTSYAGRWSIEVAIETAKGPMGVGQARSRSPGAVERTVPFSILTMSLVIVWYARHGHHPDDMSDRRAQQPWCTAKTEPSFEDMIAKLRRTVIAGRFMPKRPDCPTPQEIRTVQQAWESAAA